MLAKYFSIIRNYVLSVSSQRKYNFYHQHMFLDPFRANSRNIIGSNPSMVIPLLANQDLTPMLIYKIFYFTPYPVFPIPYSALLLFSSCSSHHGLVRFGTYRDLKLRLHWFRVTFLSNVPFATYMDSFCPPLYQLCSSARTLGQVNN